MPDYVVLRLTPAAPTDATTFASYLAGLTVKVYDISYDNANVQVVPAALAVSGASESSSTVTLTGSFGAIGLGDPILVTGVGAGYDGVFVCTSANNATSLTYQVGATGLSAQAGGTVQPHVIGVAQYNSPTPTGTVNPPFYTYPGGTGIAQHFDPANPATLFSVATAIIAIPTGIPQYLSPSIKIELDRSGQSVVDPNVYYDVVVFPGPLPTPDQFQDPVVVPPSDVSAYITLPVPLSSTTASVPTSSAGSVPKFADVLAAVTTVLSQDPGGAPTMAEIAGLSVDQCRAIAYEIAYGPPTALPGPSDSLENMYTAPINDGAPSNPHQQSLSAFQGSLAAYYAPKNAAADVLAKSIASLSAALWCEQYSLTRTGAILDFPVNPNPSAPPINATVTEAEVVITGNPGLIQIPAEYFYVLTAALPLQMTPLKRFQMVTSADEQHNLTLLTDAVSSGTLSSSVAYSFPVSSSFVPPSAMNPAQAADGMRALRVQPSSTAVKCDITILPTSSVAQIWTDWLAYPANAAWTSFAPGDDIAGFWAGSGGEAATQPGPFLDLVLCVLTEAYIDPASGNALASEIKSNLTVSSAPVTSVADLALALPSDWKMFFANQPVPVIASVPHPEAALPTFTAPGTFDARVSAFIRYFESFFGTQPLAPPTFSASVTASPSLNPPSFDVIGATLGSLTFGTAFTAAQLASLDTAAGIAVSQSPQAKAWVLQAITTINDLSILTNAIVPPSLRFSVMEALFARGFTSADDILDLPQTDFQQALSGTVAFDLAATIYTGAGTPTSHPETHTNEFVPVNPGSLTDCVPPLYLSPLGPVAYLHDMLQVSPQSTCDAPFAPARGQAQNLAGAIGQRRGPIDTLLVTRANLETPLPLVDIVNECLEHAVSSKPPQSYGTVYDTAGEALGGHALCAEECCTEEEEHGHAARCHAPATLFAALPEHSTPASPLPSAGAFAYDVLKSDFSSCCLPYSQALDVSRTYVEHFRTCRFELMRTFRKCITEYVLAPAKPPAGFRSYLWRYPVRIDIAIEYLKITPDEYTLLFGGVWPEACATAVCEDEPGEGQGTVAKPQTLQPWQLYGFADALGVRDGNWTKTAVQVSEFLARTCLTYCELVELWKSGFVRFSNGGDPAGVFPECEPCCLEKLELAFADPQGQHGASEMPLYQLAVFIRLWRKLKGLCGGGYSFAQLADICTALPLFNGGTVNPEFVRQLVALQMLRDQLRLPLTDECASVASGAAGADRTFLLSLWSEAGHQRPWALERFLEGVEHFALCRFTCERREPEFLRQLARHLDCLSSLAGFDPAMPGATWHAAPTHTLRFAEVLAKIYASDFSIGEILFLFTADDRLHGEEHEHEHGNEHEHAHGHDQDHEHEHEHDQDNDREHSPWHVRRRLLERHVRKEEREDWTWTRLESALQHEFGCGGAQPPLHRQQRMFDCWERIFDYERVRDAFDDDDGYDVRFFQDQADPVYALTDDDCEDDRWMVRVARAEEWLESVSQCFRAGDVDVARPELWASDDPAALVPAETETGNANLSRFLRAGCLETGAPRLYDDLEKLNDGLRERGRCALVAYLCGANGIAKNPKELSDRLLLDVEAGRCEKASRIEEAITAAQTFVQRCRIGLEPSWQISPQFAQMWDSRFASYHVWQACKRHELYKENWIDWHELERAKKIESFGFMEEELRRVSLTIAAPGGAVYWPEQRPQAPGLCLLQERDAATMQLLPAPREGLALLAAPERDGRPSWVTTAPGPSTLPFWMESAIELGTRFVRVAAAGHPPASTPFAPWKSSHATTTPAGTKEENCVECCTECGCAHAAHVDEYYFWLVDGRHFDPAVFKNTYDAQQNSYYDRSVQDSTPWHDPAVLPNLLEWPSEPMVRLAWYRVHNGKSQQRRISDGGIDVSTQTATPDISFEGRFADSLYFQVTNVAGAPGFRYDLDGDVAIAKNNLAVPTTPSVPTPPGGLAAYPYFAYFTPGARLFPWSPYSPAIAVANALRAHCRFEPALKWYDLYYDPLHRDNTWTKCARDGTPHPATGVSGTLGAAGAVPTPAVLAGSTNGGGPVNGGASDPVTTCCDSTDVSCHVARERSVLLHYLETLVEWGDAVMRRDSPEQFQQARVIFDGAARILARRPHRVLNPAAAHPAGASVAAFVPLPAPINPRLMMLYDRLDDRLGLIQRCLDGRRLRQASERHDGRYWGDDPVRDGWRSDLRRCCDEGESCAPHSPYRFTFLIQKAKELAGQTRELGNALLAAFEKGDAEYLASVRAVHERELLVLGREIRQGEYRDADFQVQALQKTKESDQASWRYYANLIANGLITNENNFIQKTGEALTDRTYANIAEFVAEVMIVINDIWIGSNGPTTQIPIGTKLSDLSKTIARVYNTLGDIAGTTASLDATLGGWDRRDEDWVEQVLVLSIQIEQVELQILGAQRRRDNALRQLNNSERQIEQSTEVMNFLRDKFTSHAVYLFLQKYTADLHYQMYELALSAARDAERAFHVEHGHDARTFIACESWDNLHDGLLVGDRLQLALARMDKEYCDHNGREYELTKHVSLRLQFPLEFLRLKRTGRCEIDLAEWRFDQDYPGHFMRRIKSLTVTIPGVSGPYNGVHCQLSLLGSATRVAPLLSISPAQCCDRCKSGNGYETCAHDPRIVRQYAATEAIATSSGQNDSGLFELSFHDERYLPFEFHGAVSKWRIELPPENNFFDLDTLSDFVLHLNYTAREGGSALRHAAREAAGRRLPGAGWCLFDVPHDFPDAWRLLRTGAENELKLKFSRNSFPFVPGHRELHIGEMTLLFGTCEEPACGRCAGECGCGEEKTRASWRVGFARHRDDCDETVIRCAASEEWPDLYHGVFDARMGPLAGKHDRHEATFRFPAHAGEIAKLFLLCRYEFAPERCE